MTDTRIKDIKVPRKEAAEYLDVGLYKLQQLTEDGTVKGESISAGASGRKHYRYSISDLAEAKKRLDLLAHEKRAARKALKAPAPAEVPAGNGSTHGGHRFVKMGEVGGLARKLYERLDTLQNTMNLILEHLTRPRG